MNFPKKLNEKIKYIIVYIHTSVKELKYILEVSNPIETPAKILKKGIENESFNNL